MSKNTKPASPWVLDQRRIRRLRAKVRSGRDYAARWEESSNAGWKSARVLHAHIIATDSATEEQRAEFSRMFDDEQF